MIVGDICKSLQIVLSIACARKINPSKNRKLSITGRRWDIFCCTVAIWTVYSLLLRVTGTKKEINGKNSNLFTEYPY